MVKVFFSYSHRDESMRNELEVHLQMLRRQRIVQTWHDRRIEAGKDIHSKIDEQLESADIILLLVSPYFLASDYCYDVEMKRAMERHSDGAACVIPIILEPCDWKPAPFGNLLAVPTDGKPVSKFTNMHDAFLEVVTAIREAATRMLGEGAEYATGLSDTSTAVELLVESEHRSSNLRVRKSFNDQERDEFLDGAFNYIANFFENSLQELEKRNVDVTTRFKRSSESKWSAFVYRRGDTASECCVQIDEAIGRSITYSSNASMYSGYNESLSVVDDGFTLFLRPLGTAMLARDFGDALPYEGAAEYFWAILIRPLQS
ncbi:hypothetical protein Mal4_01050 [Maioricimonas rarisocia]|uniref:TIR domain-containing protein n=1 Tax=Maioricimonas rarisocia TaxID=2528026 RepID=A0A517Z051_9PLAN|nr:toll/interleukin-1 receptor domain-containing protein [Maioricimonas rarisocia]QDU35823.1 hypothetical protein Mal4_01050 [Maioricimonas rarisocia]